MQLSLRTSATNKPVGSYDSPVVPRIGEFVNFTELVSFRVVAVHYQIHEQENERVDLEVTPVNDAACEYIAEVLYQSV